MSGLVCVEVRQSEYRSLAARRNLTDRDIRELILQSVCDTLSLEDKDIVVDKVTFGQVVLQVLQVYPVSIIPHCFIVKQSLY